MDTIPFHEVRLAAYCRRKLYYRRRSDRGDGVLDGPQSAPDDDPPPSARDVRALASEYPALLERSEAALAREPIRIDPQTYRSRLERTRRRLDRWAELVDPPRSGAFVRGRRCHGVIDKVLEDPLAPSLVSAARPPPRGVWRRQSVHAVAAAKALAWEHGRAVDRAFVEYPAYGVVRPVRIDLRRRIAYRRALRGARERDDPPRRTWNRAKCESCEYAGECGVRTRTLRSLLGR